jgi:hypothetical protein
MMKLRERLSEIKKGMVLVAPSSAYLYINNADDIDANDIDEINNVYYELLKCSIRNKKAKVEKLKEELAKAKADLEANEEYRDNYTHLLDREIIEEYTRPSAGGTVLKIEGKELGKFWDEAEWESEFADKLDVGKYKPLRMRKCKKVEV